ncbi:MAG: BtpA/SgcQ family protein [Methylobacteriaceae bacterium]|nr:BtpA/SgcQ family protein [Methylobacteriaceae bacterium]
MSELLSLVKAARKPVVGMVQLTALPGSCRFGGGRIDGVLEPALQEAEVLAAHSIDGLMVQNLGDLPVDTRATFAQVAWMTRVASELRRQFKLPVGLNLLENDAEAMFAVASAAAADFVRIKVFIGAMMTPFGIETAQAHAAIRARKAADAEGVAIFADVHDRTGTPIASGGFAEDLDFAVRLGGADGLVLTGKSTQQTLEYLAIARKALGAVPILVGGGATAANFAELASLADGVIVSSSLKDTASAFGRFDRAKVKAFMDAAGRARAPARADAGTDVAAR